MESLAIAYTMAAAEFKIMKLDYLNRLLETIEISIKGEFACESKEIQFERESISETLLPFEVEA